jgi:hypothetical protein
MPPKTIQIFLPDGEPSGIRVADLTTRTVLAVAVPRNGLGRFFQRPEATHIATYFLFGGSDDEAKPVAYVGQTEDLKKRFVQHDKDEKKEFWTVAVALISRPHTFTQAHIRWLEWKAIATAKEANRYRLENGNAGYEPFVTEPILADLEEIFETGSLLLEALGYPIFRPLVSKSPASGDPEPQEIWTLKGPKASARGVFTASGFVVLKGSRCRVAMTPSAKGSTFDKRQETMISKQVLVRDGDYYVFAEDYEFKSPSGSAAIVLARHANGWNEWRNAEGRTLDEVKRANGE